MTVNKNILFLPGDGIGPEVCEEAKVLLRVNELFGLDFKVSEELVGGVAFEKTGNPLPNQTLEAAKSADAILLGAVGGPVWDDLDYELRPERALLGLSQS